MTGRRVLITGGAGFIGGSIAAAMQGRDEVRVLDSYVRTGSAETASPRLADVEYIEGDVLDVDTLKQAMRGCDVVVHAAGIAGVDTVGRSPATTLRVNALGTDAVLAAAANVGVAGRVVCFSTSEIFGPFAFDVAETSSAVVGAVGESRWTYAASKLMAEHLAFAYWREFHVPTVVVRPFNVYGPGQLGEGAIRNFVLRAIKNETLTVRGSGNQIRSWCFIDDFVRGVMATIERDEAVGGNFNIGNAREVSTTLELARRIKKLACSNSEIQHVEASCAEIQARVPNTEKARTELGFEAQTDLDDGLRLTIDWMRSLR
jgi:UDP-glucose 4-epimerase